MLSKEFKNILHHNIVERKYAMIIIYDVTGIRTDNDTKNVSV